MKGIPDEWNQYGRSLTRAMAEVLDETPEELRPHLLETADYWISVGLTIGLKHPGDGRRLLAVIEKDEAEQAELLDDAVTFLEEALG
jgi:hypothetical protein